MAVNDIIRDKNIKNQVYTLRSRNNTVKQVIKTFNKVESDLRAKILSIDGETLTKKRSKIILKWATNSNNKLKELINVQTEKELKDFIEAELEFQNDSIKSSIPSDIDISTVIPSTDLVLKTARSRPYQTKKMKQWFSNWSLDNKRIVENTVKAGVIRGQTIQQMTRELFGTRKNNFKDGKLQVSRNQIQIIVRTTTSHVLNTTKDVFYQENEDVIKGYQWVSTLDSRTSLICINLDGKKDLYDGSVTELNGEIPPAHYNRVVKGEKITTRRGLIPIEKVKVGDYVLTHTKKFRRVYATIKKYNTSDRVLKLVCSNGASISLTDDHPILTHNRGWIYSRDIKIGDIVFQNFYKFNKIPNNLNYIKHKYIKYINIFETSVTREHKPLKAFSSSIFNIFNFILSYFVSNFSTTKISNIEEIIINDFMYDLSVEKDETYIANGILVHNCRSATTPILKSWKELGFDRNELPQSTRASMNGQVAESITYPKWLETQPAKFQREVLGSTRYKAWKDGKIKLNQFTDNKNNILTIDQLKQKGLEINGG